MPSAPGEVRVRRAGPEDVDAAIELAQAALGWEPGRPNADLFRWKHLENPFGPSPMWLAECEGRLAGFRTFLRWRFVRPDGSTASAVRAVDTATHPDFQGRGIFTKLTLAALDDLRDEGTDFVYNTPNDKSRPGYLKMGWVEVGRVPVQIRLRSPKAALRVAKAKVPAEKWSQDVQAGTPAPQALTDADAIESLLQVADRRGDGYRTDRSVAHLRWRYRFEPLHYRAVCVDDDQARGVCIFRVRQRGAATEATICELLVRDPKDLRTLTRRVARVTGADYLIASGPRLPLLAGFVPLPRQGPILTWRHLAQANQPTLGDWALSLGDIELF